MFGEREKYEMDENGFSNIISVQMNYVGVRLRRSWIINNYKFRTTNSHSGQQPNMAAGIYWTSLNGTWSAYRSTNTHTLDSSDAHIFLYTQSTVVPGLSYAMTLRFLLSPSLSIFLFRRHQLLNFDGNQWRNGIVIKWAFKNARNQMFLMQIFTMTI